MEQEYRDDDIDWPPRDIDDVIWPAAWEHTFRATKEAAKARHPDRVADIEPLDDDCMYLQMIRANGGEGPLCLMHGVMLFDKAKDNQELLLLKEADTENILNSLQPQLRIEIAREIVWQYIMETIKAADDAECADLVDVEVTYEEEAAPVETAEKKKKEEEPEENDGEDFASSIPEINAYREQGGDVVEEEEEDGAEEGDDDNDDENESEEHEVETDEFDDGQIFDKDGMDGPEEDPVYIAFANKDPALRAMYVKLVQGRFHYAQD